MLNFPNVILPVSPPSISLIWFRTKIIGNSITHLRKLFPASRVMWSRQSGISFCWQICHRFPKRFQSSGIWFRVVLCIDINVCEEPACYLHLQSSPVLINVTFHILRVLCSCRERATFQPLYLYTQPLGIMSRKTGIFCSIALKTRTSWVQCLGNYVHKSTSFQSSRMNH